MVCGMASSSISPLGGSNSSSIYSCSQLLSIQVCNSCSYSSLNLLDNQIFSDPIPKIFWCIICWPLPGYNPNSLLFFKFHTKISFIDVNRCTDRSCFFKLHTSILHNANATEHLNGINAKQQVEIQRLPSHNQHINHSSVTSCHVNFLQCNLQRRYV